MDSQLTADAVFTPGSIPTVGYAERRPELVKRIRQALQTPGLAVLIVGPLAVGKSAISLHELRKVFGTVIRTRCDPQMGPSDLVRAAVGPAKGSPSMRNVARLLEEKHAAWLIEDADHLATEALAELPGLIKAFIDLGARKPQKLVVTGSPGLGHALGRKDLSNRLIQIALPRWEDAELDDVMNVGCELLNLEIPEALRNPIRHLASGLPGMCQELCLELCRARAVERGAKKTVVFTRADLSVALVAWLRAWRPKLENTVERALRDRPSKSGGPALRPLVLRALAELGPAGGTRSEIVAQVRRHRETSPRHVKGALSSLAGSNGELLFMDPAIQRYAFQLPVQRAYVLALTPTTSGYRLPRNADDDDYLAWAHYRLGVIAQTSGRADDAEAWQELADEVLRRTGNKWGRAAVHRQLGAVARQRGQPDRARAEYAKARDATEGEHLTQATYERNMGTVALETGAYEEADDHLRTALAAWDESVDPRGTASIHLDLGQLDLFRGRTDDAQRHTTEALERYQKLGDRAGVARACAVLGATAADRGQLRDAEVLYGRALPIFEELGDQQGLAALYSQLGLLAQSNGDLDSAMSWYETALKMVHAIGSEPAIASALHELGLVRHRRGDLAEAEALYRRSLDVGEDLGLSHSNAATYHQLGLLAKEQGNLMAMKAWFQRSLDANTELDDTPGIGRALLQLAWVASQEGAQTELTTLLGELQLLLDKLNRG